MIEARGLKAADIGGKSDPYVEVRIKGQVQSQKSRVIKVIRTTYLHDNNEFQINTRDETNQRELTNWDIHWIVPEGVGVHSCGYDNIE